MRIVAGTLKGRRIKAPAGTKTRPTIDRVRESLFSSLVSLSGPDLGGGRVLDAFAGSGSLGLEALSRGASHVTFVEEDRAAMAVILANVEALGVGTRCTVRRMNAFSLAERGAPDSFSLILLDPPYTLDPVRVAWLLDALARRGSVAEGALVSWEHAQGSPVLWPAGYEELVSKKYGTAAVSVARYVGGEGES